MQTAHWRSAVVEPGTERPWPTEHFAHAAHTSLPAATLNVPLAQVSHVRSALAVGALLRYEPAAHGALTG